MNICSVIKYEGGNNVLVWKHPEEDFNTSTQLIVHESQEAVFFCNGQISDVFRAGRYTLSTENLPFLRKIINIPTDGQTPFHCEVYFVNLVDSMDLVWGTSSPITIKDPIYDIILPVGANGRFAVRVTDSQKLLLKLVGTIQEFNQKTLGSYFKGLLMTGIKDNIGKQLTERKISFYEINSHLKEISELLAGEFRDTFSSYGIEIVNFFVNAIVVPEDNPAYIRLKEALAKKAEMGVIGYNYGQERTFDVLEKAASNEGGGSSLMGAGVGLGMGVPIGGMIGGVMNQAIQQTTNPAEPNKICPQCRKEVPAQADFCCYCGSKMREENPMVVCRQCRQSVPKGRFCISCGNRLQNQCSKCGWDNPDNAGFCMKCGEKL